MSAKKVCILTTVHPSFDTRIFHKQAKTLVEAGYDVTLIAQHIEDEAVDGVKIIALPRPRNRFGRFTGLIWKAFWLALKQKAEIYHFHDPELLFVGVLLKVCTKAKVIYDIHEDVPKQVLNKEWIPKWGRWWLATFYESVEKIALVFIDFIILAEDSYLESYSLSSNNIEVIHNYPVMSFFNREDIKPPFSQKKVVYVGGVEKLRGALELVEAAKLLQERDCKDFTLDIVGPIRPPTFRKILLTRIHDSNLDKVVHVLGPTPFEQVPEILSQASIGLATLHPNPNYVKSLPTKLLEYMAAGIPFVASDFPLWREIGAGAGLFVDPQDPRAIAWAIQWLLEHPEEAQAMGRQGRKRVAKEYNWEREGEKLIRVYKRLLA